MWIRIDVTRIYSEKPRLLILRMQYNPWLINMAVIIGAVKPKGG